MCGVEDEPRPTHTAIAPPGVHTEPVLTQPRMEALIHIDTVCSMCSVGSFKSSGTAVVSLTFIFRTEDTLVDAPGLSNPSAAHFLAPQTR